MSTSTPAQIILKRNGEGELTVFEETVVTAAITPGEFVIFSSGSVKPHNVAADADAPDILAIENAYLDPRTATDPAIDTDYAVAAKAKLVFPQPGDLLYCFLEAAANVAKGAPLEHNGSGHLQAYTSGKIVAYAAEAKDNSAGGSPVRIKVWKA